MTEGPPVTITDPHAWQFPPPAPRPGWTTTERGLALVIAGVLLVGLAAARHVTPRATGNGLSATVVGHDVILGSPSVVRVQLELRAEPPRQMRLGNLVVGRGWQLGGRIPPVLAGRVLVTVVHPLRCPDGLPDWVELDPVHGRSLRVRLRRSPALDLCDPLRGAEAVHVLTSSRSHTALRLGLVDVSTRPVTLSAISFPGFSFTASLPLALPGRDSSQILDLRQLPVRQLQVVASVTSCSAARQALAHAGQTGTPDELVADLDGRTGALEVQGLETYLERQWRATCVR